MRTSWLPAALFVLVLGCVHPREYRVATSSGEPYVIPPNTYLRSVCNGVPGRVSIDVFDVASQGASCGRADDGDGLSALILYTFRRDHIAVSARFTGNSQLFGDRATLASAFDRWVASNSGEKEFIKCTKLDVAATRRSLLAQRPMTGAESLEEGLGFRGGATEPSPHALLRTVVLRPGMSVCAADVASAAPAGSGLMLAGTSCARVVGAPEGGATFDPMLGTINNLQSATLNFGMGIHRIGSWAEVQRPGREAMIFVVIEPRDLPAFIDPAADPEPTGPSILAGIKLRDGAGEPPPGLLAILSAGSAIHDLRVDEVCKLADVVCFSLGLRSIITAMFDVALNGQTRNMGVGATVGDVLDLVSPDLFGLDLMGAAGVALGSDASARARLAQSISQLRMERVFEGRLVRVRLRTDLHAVVTLPLQPGDRFAW